MRQALAVLVVVALAACGDKVEVADTSTDTAAPDTLPDTPADTTTETGLDATEDSAGDTTDEPDGWRYVCHCYDHHSPDSGSIPIWTYELCVPAETRGMDLEPWVRPEEYVCEDARGDWCNCQWDFCTHEGSCYLTDD